MMNAIEIKNITKEYKTFKLDNVSFNVEEGHIVGFIGRNGAGTKLLGMFPPSILMVKCVTYIPGPVWYQTRG